MLAVQRCLVHSKGLQVLAYAGGVGRLHFPVRGLAIGTPGYRRRPKGDESNDKATSDVQPVSSPQTSSLAASAKTGDEWTPVQHESGEVYYWNKKTGQSPYAAVLAL